MKRFANPATPAEIQFNQMLGRGRFKVETGIGWWKNWCRVIGPENKPHYEPHVLGLEFN
jgi:hypothetical protein